MRTRLLALLLVAAAALGGCGSACEDLGKRICGCQPSEAQRENCRRAVEEQLDQGKPKPGEAQQDFCEAKLDTCGDSPDGVELCDWLATSEGKTACGLAYPVQ